MCLLQDMKQLYAIHKVHVPASALLVFHDISGEQFSHRLRMWQPLQYVAQRRTGFLAVDLGGLDQAVDLGTGRSAFRRIAEQPCLASDHERLYRSFGGIVVDR